MLWRHSLIASAFLLPCQGWAAAAPLQPDRLAAAGVFTELQQWVRYPQLVRILDRPIDYGEICRWSPVKQRENLQALARQPSGCCVPLLPEQLRVPDDFPRLSFVVASVQCFNAFPQLPEAHAVGVRAWELRARLAGHRGYIEHRPVQPEQVLLPADFRDAVVAGLRMWIAELAQRQLVRGWDLQLGRNGLVLLELTCMDDEACTALVPIRLHQVGPDGLDSLMIDLQARLAASRTLAAFRD